MALWQALLVGFGGNAVLLLVLSFLGRGLINNFFNKDIEKFKGNLQLEIEKFKGDSQLAIEKFKGELELAAIEHEIRFTKLHERRAEVLADIYKFLNLAIWETEDLLAVFEWPGKKTKEEKYQSARNAIVEYARFFAQNRIYFTEDLCSSLETIARRLRTLADEFGVYLNFEQPSDTARKQKIEAWVGGWNSLQIEIPPMRNAIEKEFRQLLGSTSPGQKQAEKHS